MLQNVEACEWLTGALRALEAPHLDPCYAKMRAVCPLTPLRFLRYHFVMMNTIMLSFFNVDPHLYCLVIQ